MSRRTRTWQIAVAATAVAAATAVGAGPASAHGGQSTYPAQHKGPGGTPTPDGKCVFTVEGKTWTPGKGLASIKPSSDGRISIGVTADGGTCTVSLAVYLAQGPDFASSGQQVLTDFSTVTVQRHKKGTLTVSAPATGCFAQIDLYKGSTEYDGKTGAGHGPAPHGPNGSVIGSNLLASWNGPTGGKDCTTTEPTTPPASPSPSDSATPTDTPTGTPTDTPTGTPSGSPTDTSSATPSDTASATATATSSAPAVGDTDSPSPSATGSLAHTGSSGNTGLFATLAVVLVALGGAVTFVVRRRGTGRAH
ncbi:hypothetical protein OG896_01685 [Streptomyces sp. NBC_00669]|uniref:LAETG motif-containing sortase-dependent surface protein n=1 Tax=Streptomyces sp. NBC_00669 TaxID=2976011 RepID=UPI002E314499|nr:LAETG motif-containing sortase-dependent surface protein [Streptomyces sp. NBC_00669]